MNIKRMDNNAEWEWFKDRTHVLWCEDSHGIVCERDGEIQAVAMFDSFSPDGCNVHWAIGNPMVLRHGWIEIVCKHAYKICGRKRIFGLVPANNLKALKLNLHIGMREVARIPHAMGEGIDYIILTMDRADCRWLSDEIREAA